MHYLDVTPMEEPDPTWRYTDPAGHVHTWMPEPRKDHESFTNYRLSNLVIGVTDSEPTDEYPGWSHYACKLCHARIQPGYRMPRHRYYVFMSEVLDARE
jgi:hypothetical protein